jgi:MATE family multidrug resistance protein
MRRYGLLSRDLIPIRRWVKAAAPYLLKVALPTGAMQALWQLGYLIFYVIVGTLPRDSVPALDGLSAGMRVEAVLFLPALAFNMTASVLVGHFLGAGQKEEAKRIALRIIIVGCCGMTMLSAVMWPWIRTIAGWISPDPGAMGYVIAYLRVNLITIPFTVGSMILSGIMIGAGSTIYSFIVNGCSIWLVRLPLAWFLGHYWGCGAQIVFIAMLVSQALQSSSLFWVFMKCDWSRFAMRGQHSARPVRIAASTL